LSLALARKIMFDNPRATYARLTQAAPRLSETMQ
jgi:hypothetical protein